MNARLPTTIHAGDISILVLYWNTRRPTSLLPERPAVLLGTLCVLLVVSSAVEDLGRLLGGEVLLALHGLALATLAVTLATVLLRVVLLCARAMSPSTSHYNLTQDKRLFDGLMRQL